MATTEDECIIKNPKTIFETFSNMIGFIPIAHPPISENLYDGFMLPIEYLDKSQRGVVSGSTMNDLELIHTTNYNSPLSSSSSMYELFCKPNTDFGKMLIPDVAKEFTVNTGFLKNTQFVIENQMSASSSKITMEMTMQFQEVWKEIKEDRTFLERHSFMEFVALEELNKSRTFLHAYSVLNLVSPLYGLVMPLLILIMPFILLKFWRIPITFNDYLSTLRDVSKQHFIGKLLHLKELTAESIIYTLFIVGMYILQTYSHIVSCIKYHNAIKRMNHNLLFMRDYLKHVIVSMEEFTNANASLPYYSDFCQDVHSNKLVLMELRDKIGDALTPYGWTWKKITELGQMLDCYYQLYSCMDYESSLRYSVGFVGYIDIVEGIARGVQQGLLGKVTLVEDNEDVSTHFIGQYYPAHANAGAITNTVDLSTNMIITGVNASGKTTTLKTTALNIIFSQQFGVGFYSSGKLAPFHHIHSYLNIPDTSGRDSLFQAESRRCKEIIDKIRDSNEHRHFCIFDELYSGTNPSEATKSAHSLLKYLSKNKRVRFILTTHYINVCRKFKKSSLVTNYKMTAEQTENGEFIYTYKLTKGISTLEGGIAILKQMNYPQEILNTIAQP